MDSEDQAEQYFFIKVICCVQSTAKQAKSSRVLKAFLLSCKSKAHMLSPNIRFRAKF